MQNITLCMRTWCEVRNFASQKFHLITEPLPPLIHVCSPRYHVKNYRIGVTSLMLSGILTHVCFLFSSYTQLLCLSQLLKCVVANIDYLLNF